MNMEFMEEFARNHEHTISALSSLGTWAAVAVSLWLTVAARRPKLRVFVDKSIFIPSDAQETGTVDWEKCEDMVGVTLRNNGSVTVYISYWSFSWTLPLPWGGHLQQNPFYPDFRREGIKIEPGQSMSISLSNDINKLREALDGLCDRARVPRLFKRLAYLHVSTADGFRFKAKMDKILRRAVMDNSTGKSTRPGPR